MLQNGVTLKKINFEKIWFHRIKNQGFVNSFSKWKRKDLIKTNITTSNINISISDIWVHILNIQSDDFLCYQMECWKYKIVSSEKCWTGRLRWQFPIWWYTYDKQYFQFFLVSFFLINLRALQWPCTQLDLERNH